MAANTGRTTSKWVTFNVDDSAGTLRTIPVSSINGVGLDYDNVDLTAFMDAIKGYLPAHANCTIDITGPFDTTAAAAAGSLSGSHTVLYNLPGGVTPLTLDVKFGVRHAWDTEPQFGITSSATDGFLCKSYIVNPDGTYSASFYVAAGSAAPAWGTAAET
jgi:hypothetical protein